ncbi:hypothetical protein Bhyg_13381 [Pseudolycoriella hygida]|uniref:Uncharacterized protein n=1 Tax=Pseudolycoriella hygida TaxID=35572 RepID=A0A9Q0MN66_9DIPT|nr:hypothetical protein Bhyg_13381 [Pseudolycoriella hygida]
MIPAQRVCK